MKSGAGGWDAYADFYDWENRRTLGRRDLAFWNRLARGAGRRVIELGCGTGRLLVPMARGGVDMTGIDRSPAMLARAAKRAGRLPPARRPALVLGDIRTLPFASRSCHLVMASYGMLQSLLTDRDLSATLRECARVLQPGGQLGIDLVPDLPRWPTYRSQVRFRGRGRAGASVTLIESVRQDRRRRLTIFDERFVETRRGATRAREFSLTFRTLPMKTTVARIARAGFRIDAVLGDYRGRAWRPGAEAWVILATRTAGTRRGRG